MSPVISKTFSAREDPEVAAFYARFSCGFCSSAGSSFADVVCSSSSALMSCCVSSLSFCESGSSVIRNCDGFPMLPLMHVASASQDLGHSSTNSRSAIFHIRQKRGITHDGKTLLDAFVGPGDALQPVLNNTLGPGESLRETKSRLVCAAIPFVRHRCQHILE